MRGPCAGSSRRGSSAQHPLERREVLREIAAAARVNHHAAAEDDEIAGEDACRLGSCQNAR